MRIASAISLYAYGTSEGVSRAWDTRGRGRAERPVSNIDRSALSKQNYVKVTADKIRAAKESVDMVARAIGGTVTSDNSPWDVLAKGTKIGIEVKRFLPGRKNLKATIHSGDAASGDRSSGAKERKVEFANKSGMKKMFLVVHDTHDPNDEAWYVKRVGDRGDPRVPKDERPGWSFNTFSMNKADSLDDLKRLVK